MNADYISRALCFHGQPMQKIWDDERGAGDLQMVGVAPQTFSVYLERQKHFTFQDRAKRLKLHQFFSRKALDLYDKNLKMDSSYHNNMSDIERLAMMEKSRPYVAVMPPFEIFVNKNQDKLKRLRCLIEGLQPGDIIYGVVTKVLNNLTPPLVTVKPLCTGEPLVRYLGDVTIKGALPKHLTKTPLNKKGEPRNFAINDFVCCEVIDLYSDRVNLTMESAFSKNKDVKFGLVTAEELPEYYRTANNNALVKYNDCLLKTKEFLNPNYDVLYELVDLNVNDTFTLMTALKRPFPNQEYAKELRRTQASKWAFRSVAEGIEHFKIGRHVEAFQCLNKALNIDPRNVEGLVARGALYANKGSFLKAVDDFDKALKLNSFHVNARKYMGETLVALGRSYEEDNRMEDALKAYNDCLNIIPNHEQARLSLETLQARPGSQLLDNLLNMPGTIDVDLGIKQKKRKSSQVSASSSDGSGSSGSESDSGSDSSDKSHNQAKKDISLSPLSKRMAQGASASATSLPTSRNQYSQPYFLANQNSLDNNSLKYPPNDFRLDDDDTETRVRKLLQDASKYKKQKTKKSKKKKSKKSKKESRKEKSTTNLIDNLDKINFKDAFQAIGLKIDPQLTENLQHYETSIAQIKKRKEILEQSTASSLNRIRGDSPPPKPPSMNLLSEEEAPPPPIIKKKAAVENKPSSRYTVASSSFSNASGSTRGEAPRFSFTIKRPIKVDKFGLVRIATPLTNDSPPTKSRSRSPSKSKHRRSRRSRSQSASLTSRVDSGISRRRSHSRSSSLDGHRRTQSRRSRSRHSRSRRSRSRSRDRNNRVRSRSPRRRVSGRRRTPSPFVARGSPYHRRRRSDSNERTRVRRPSPRKNFGNRVWQRPGYNASAEPTKSSERWLHDKFNANDPKDKPEEGPTIEEIDEIITKAQKERKEEIIKRDKNILKKSV